MITELLGDGPVVVNIGVRDFADSLSAQGVPVVQVDWAPPVTDPDIVALLEELG